MIKRYTLPKMGQIWEDQNKFRQMLEVELLVCEALSREGGRLRGHGLRWGGLFTRKR